MFDQTLTLTINGVDKVLNRVNQDNFSSAYRYKALDGSESINLQVRHTSEKTADGLVNRHNVFVDWTVTATPTTAKKYYTLTYTIRELDGSAPADLLNLSAGMLTLLGVLDDGLVIGTN